MQSDDEIRNRFIHHPPTSERIKEAHEQLRSEFLDLALRLNEFLPEGREKSLALTKLETSMFWANSAIARTQTIGG